MAYNSSLISLNGWYEGFLTRKAIDKSREKINDDYEKIGYWLKILWFLFHL